MARRRKFTPIREVKIILSEETATKLDILLLDEEGGKRTYGARSHLIETLLRDWISRRDAVEGAILP